jgi:regulator of sirC expression with transglutaminase-like and TPR domain
MQEIKTELLQLLRRNDLLRASLLVGKVQEPNFSLDPYVEKILALAARVWHRCGRHRNDPVYIAETINYVLFQELGIQGKSEKSKQVIDDPHQHYVHLVLERKVASPISLAVLYSILAEQVGLSHEVLAMPNYFLLKVKDTAQDFYIDPFENGRFLNQEDFLRKFRTALQRNRMLSSNLFEKVSSQQLVSRLIQQLKHVYILKGNALEALRAVEVLTAFFPHSPELTRDRGILYCEMEYFSKAMEDLRFYLKSRPEAEDVGEIKKLTSMLKGYREVMN